VRVEVDRRVKRVLIWRQGSLGDTIVALPSFHVIAETFPDAERRLLTNQSANPNIAPAVDVLRNANLVHGTIAYPVQTRSLAAIFRLAKEIRSWKPEVGIYLVEARGQRQHLRDLLFMRLLGVSRVVGFSPRGALSDYPVIGPDGLRESEASRLLRAVAALGEAGVDEDAAWDLRLGADEVSAAARALAPVSGASGVLAFSIGTKVPANDYGDANWGEVLTRLGDLRPDLAVVGLGAPGEAARTDRLLERWPGPSLNLCGTLHVRESAAVLKQSMAFMGHDSGPMHLAAAMGTPCVAVFSARNPPGIWFPRGRTNAIFYKATSCSPCGLAECHAEGMRCILTIDPGAVARACAELCDVACAKPVSNREAALSAANRR
jgi:heptosyltransferase III